MSRQAGSGAAPARAAAPAVASAMILRRDYDLPPHAELRIAVPLEPRHAAVTFRLLDSSEGGAAIDDDSDPARGATGAASAGGGGNRCEVLGTELRPGMAYAVASGGAAALFTQTGCRVRVEAEARAMQGIYASCNTLHMRALARVHDAVHQRRLEAKAAGAEGVGPRVLVCSPFEGCGTTTVAQTLAAYAVRRGHNPLYIDLNVANPALGGIGCVSVAALQYPIDVEEGMSLVPRLSYFYGGTVVDRNLDLLRHCVTCAMSDGEQRIYRSDRCRVGGVIVDCPPVSVVESNASAFGTSSAAGGGAGALGAEGGGAGGGAAGWVDTNASKPAATGRDGSGGDQLLLFLSHVIAECGIDTVVCVGGDTLRYQIARTITGDPRVARLLPSEVVTPSGARVRMFSVPAIEGCVPRFPEEREAMRREQWRRYFFGSLTSPFAPSAIDVPLASVRFARLGTVAAESLQGLLPIDNATQLDAAQVTFLPPSDVAKLLHHVLAVSSVPVANGESQMQIEESVKRGVIVGHVWVVGFALERGVIKLLSPQPTLPHANGTCFMVGDIVLPR